LSPPFLPLLRLLPPLARRETHLFVSRAAKPTLLPRSAHGHASRVSSDAAFRGSGALLRAAPHAPSSSTNSFSSSSPTPSPSLRVLCWHLRGSSSVSIVVGFPGPLDLHALDVGACRRFLAAGAAVFGVGLCLCWPHYVPDLSCASVGDYAFGRLIA
jgi:hypothetical protein